MFKEFYESGHQIPEKKEEKLTLAQESRLNAIEILKEATQNETLSLSERLKKLNALITLLKEDSLRTDGSIISKIDIAEAETYKDQLLHDSSNHSDSNQKKEKAF